MKGFGDFGVGFSVIVHGLISYIPICTSLTVHCGCAALHCAALLLFLETALMLVPSRTETLQRNRQCIELIVRDGRQTCASLRFQAPNTLACSPMSVANTTSIIVSLASRACSGFRQWNRLNLSDRDQDAVVKSFRGSILHA